MSDVYDGQAWQEFVGSATAPCERIILQGCSDAIPAFQCGSLSLKPLMFSNFSVAPKFRMQAEFMFLYMLMPTSIKGFAQKKFFDYVAKRELNDLYETGATYVFLIVCHRYYSLSYILQCRSLRRQSQSFRDVDGHARARRITWYVSADSVTIVKL